VGREGTQSKCWWQCGVRTRGRSLWQHRGEWKGGGRWTGGGGGGGSKE
jgi:hypothetical protein